MSIFTNIITYNGQLPQGGQTYTEYGTNVDNYVVYLQETIVNGFNPFIETLNNAIDNYSIFSLSATDLISINSVYGALGNIQIVVTDMSNVNTTAGAIGNVNTVANNISNVNTVATNTTNINLVATDINNVVTISTNINDINTVANNVNNITIVANNQSAIDLFANNYSDFVIKYNNLISFYQDSNNLEVIKQVSKTVSDMEINHTLTLLNQSLILNKSELSEISIMNMLGGFN